MRAAGATEVHMRVGSPPVKHPCFYGIDTPKRRELLASTLSDLTEMALYLKADSVAFLPTEGLLQVLKDNTPVLTQENADDPKGGWCVSCFSGKYEDAIAQKDEE